MEDAKEPAATAAQVEEGTHDTGIAVSVAVKVFQSEQRSLSVHEAVKQHWKSISWCFYVFFICVMFGYDALASSVVISIEQFRHDFGYLYEGAYVVDASWQLGFQAAFLFGIVLGGIITGICVDRFGRPATVFGAYLINVGGVFLQYFCTTPAQFFGGKLLTGIPLGTFSTIAPTYAAEMAPLVVRGAITAGMNLAIVLGNLLGYIVLRQASFYTGKDTYRILFATQWGFVGVALAILPFFPESPYWLVAHGKEDRARQTIAKLHGPDYDVDGHLADIRTTLEQQHSESRSQGTMAECFTRENWRRTAVAVMMFFIQNACGTGWVIGYMSYFMQLAGMASAQAFDATVGISGLMVVGNLSGWFFVEYFGRRGTALYGTLALCACLFVIGILAVVPTPGALVTQVVFMGVWAFVYQGTVGSVAWPISAENATSRLRNATQSLCTIMNGLSACIWGFSLPYAINPDQGNLQGKIAFVFAAILVVSAVFIFFFVPETKGRSYSDIDELWRRCTAPRKFAQTVISPTEGPKEDA
ncbi:general substrate transporter [Thozetella sp. PMI_491]|nr:general substrate transporter [Thozetella sp. PMI_491]